MSFHIATEEAIREGRVTDVYFHRTRQILEARDLNPEVRAELAVKDLPGDWDWAILAGLDEALGLLEGCEVDVRSAAEGTLFREQEPVMEIHGPYQEFAIHETALLGFLCQATGVATAAGRCRRAAGERLILAFGARRLHPAATPAIERAAYLGGCDGVSTITGAEAAGIEPSGTIPHALVLVIGDTVEATRAFHQVIRNDVPRVSLIDTFHDEKFEAIRVARELGQVLDSVRLDTPGSRKGDFYELFREVRWELDARGFGHVDLFASGGIDEAEIRELNPVVDGYGVGGAISAAPIVDFAMDIVEIEGEPLAKRGKWSGAKNVLVCSSCGDREIVPLGTDAGACGACGAAGGARGELLRTRIRRGAPVEAPPEPGEIRSRVLEQLREVDELEPSAVAGEEG